MTPAVLFDWAVQTLVAFVATIAFSIIFHTPRNQYAFAGITGAVGWLIYIVYMHFSRTPFSLRFSPRSAWRTSRASSPLCAARR